MRKSLTCIFLFLSISSFSQIKIPFVKGVLINKAGVRKTGLVKDESVKDLNRRIIFKEDINSKTETYKAEELSTVELENGEKYTSLQISLDIENSSKKTIVLGRNLIDGKLSLYEFFFNGEQLFIMKKDSEEKVIRNSYIDELTGKAIRFEFKETINALVADCFEASDMLPLLSYQQKQFEEVVKIYNKCAKSSMKIYSKSKSKNNTVQHLILGINGIKFGDKSEFSGGLIYRKYFPKINEKFSLNVSLHYSQINNTFEHTYQPILFDYRTEVVKAEYSVGSLSSYFQYNILNSQFRPFIFLGLGIHNSKYNYARVSTDKLDPPQSFEKPFGINGLLGGGIEYNFYKGLMAKTEYRYDIMGHYLTIGLAYNFLHNK